MTRSNKFNIRWQIVRVRARRIKDVRDKITYVLKWLNCHKNWHNYDRVLNWLRTTGMGYASSQWGAMFTLAVSELKGRATDFASQLDTDGSLDTVHTEDLIMVYRDLQKRKYGFQFKEVPQGHIQFVAALTTEFERRGVDTY